MTSLPTDNQALQFAVMLRAGVPPETAIQYFIETDDVLAIRQTLTAWLRSKAVGAAQRQLQGKDWQDLSDDEAIEAALQQHYRGLAYLLFSTNYMTARSDEKLKLDEARKALEAKRAGTAGKMNALEEFYQELRQGKVKLSIPSRVV